MELKLGGGVGGMVWWPPNFGEAETLVDGGQRRTASRKPFLGGLWLIFCSSNNTDDDESTSTSSRGVISGVVEATPIFRDIYLY